MKSRSHQSDCKWMLLATFMPSINSLSCKIARNKVKHKVTGNQNVSDTGDELWSQSSNKFDLEVGQRSKVRAWCQWQELVTRIMHAKYQCSIIIIYEPSFCDRRMDKLDLMSRVFAKAWENITKLNRHFAHWFAQRLLRDNLKSYLPLSSVNGSIDVMKKKKMK